VAQVENLNVFEGSAKSVNVVCENTASSVFLIDQPAATSAGITSPASSPSITVIRAFARDSALM